jgi:hypothetical protein
LNQTGYDPSLFHPPRDPLCEPGLLEWISGQHFRRVRSAIRGAGADAGLHDTGQLSTKCPQTERLVSWFLLEGG